MAFHWGDQPDFPKPVADAFDAYIDGVRYLVQPVADDNCYYGFAFQGGEELAFNRAAKVETVLNDLRQKVKDGR